MTSFPNLYLKWAVFKNLVGLARSDAQIARTVFGSQFGHDHDVNEDNRPSLFSKMLKGEYGLQPEIAVELANVMNAGIEVYRGERKLQGRSPKPLSANDLYCPLYDFTRHVIAAVEKPDPDAMLRTHRELLGEFAPKGPDGNAARLLVKRFATDRFFESMQPSGGNGPVVFDPGHHMGQLSIEGLAHDPVAAYTFVALDPSPQHWIWDFSWGETVSWMPSPFKPLPAGNGYNLLPAPERVKPIPGRFLVTAIVVLDKDALARLDPRGADAAPGIFDEHQTARLLTMAQRLASRKNPPIMLATNEYRVVERESERLEA